MNGSCLSVPFKDGFQNATFYKSMGSVKYFATVCNMAYVVRLYNLRPSRETNAGRSGVCVVRWVPPHSVRPHSARILGTMAPKVSTNDALYSTQHSQPVLCA